MPESKQDTVGWETFFSLSLSCVAWWCRLPALPAGMYTAQGGQWIPLNDTKARKLRLGDEAACIAQPPAAPNQELQKARKTALICPLFLSLSPSLLFLWFSLSFRLFSSSLCREPLLSLHLAPLLELCTTWYYHISSHCSNDVSCSRRINLTHHTHTFAVTLYLKCDMMHNKQIKTPPSGWFFFFFYSIFKVNIKKLHPILCHVIKNTDSIKYSTHCMMITTMFSLCG